MRLSCLAALVPLCATPVFATDPNFTMGLADVIAAESFCGMSYDQTAIEAAIAANVEAEDMGFTHELKGLVYVAERSQEKMSASARTAHCAQVRRLAKSYGFTP